MISENNKAVVAYIQCYKNLETTYNETIEKLYLTF